MRKLPRFGARVLGVLALLATLLVLLSPWLLYELGLSRFDKLPDKPAQLATAEQQALVWERVLGTGMPRIERMNPYGFVFDFFTQDSPRITPGERMADVVATDYASQQRPLMGNAHLERVALAIWLTRHWTTEELASAAYPIVSRWRPRKPRAPALPASGGAA